MNPVQTSRGRRGLGPVGTWCWSLPILLFVMALIVCYGTISAWKVREHSVARLAVWETRWPRSGATDPRPSYWPATASMGVFRPGQCSRAWTTAESICRSRAARCPQRPSIPTCWTRPVDCAKAPRHLTRKYPMLSKMGQLHDHGPDMADRRQVAIPADGDGEQLATANSCACMPWPRPPRRWSNAYVQSVMAIINAPFARTTGPAGPRPGFHLLRHTFRMGRRPDFYPEFHSRCARPIAP